MILEEEKRGIAIGSDGDGTGVIDEEEEEEEVAELKKNCFGASGIVAMVRPLPEPPPGIEQGPPPLHIGQSQTDVFRDRRTKSLLDQLEKKPPVGDGMILDNEEDQDGKLDLNLKL
ncbi:unnamed protein product [Cuscuta epithymum]|uniref:Uncharacterized protein n=1 Tax=Cuscuta epithymum TaxID=186058 RepID=A0AAV0FL35_9ASTE|nr:unnamed protein product [Cuscuta epithymum]CAH9136295.1 unnamed protein product [Cuscuta epithymum]